MSALKILEEEEDSLVLDSDSVERVQQENFELQGQIETLEYDLKDSRAAQGRLVREKAKLATKVAEVEATMVKSSEEAAAKVRGEVEERYANSVSWKGYKEIMVERDKAKEAANELLRKNDELLRRVEALESRLRPRWSEVGMFDWLRPKRGMKRV
jgi:hypothetical protein